MKPYDVVEYAYGSDLSGFIGNFEPCYAGIADCAIAHTENGDYLNVILFKLRNGQIIKVRKK